MNFFHVFFRFRVLADVSKTKDFDLPQLNRPKLVKFMKPLHPFEAKARSNLANELHAGRRFGAADGEVMTQLCVFVHLNT